MKHLIKYGAIFMAVILSASIIGTCVSLAVELGRAITGDGGHGVVIVDGKVVWEAGEGNTDGDDTWEFFGLRINGSAGVKSGTFTDINAEEVSRLYIDNSYCAVSVETGSTYMVEYENIPEDYVIEVANGTLKIAMEPVVINVGFVDFNREPAKIRVTVPEGTVFEKVTIDNGSGAVLVDSLSTGILWIDSGSGAVRVQNMLAENTMLDMGSGALSISDSEMGDVVLDTGSGAVHFQEVVARNLAADSGSGSIRYQGVLSGNCVFDTGSGSVNLELSGREEDYNIRADLGSGGLYVNGERLEDDVNIKYKNAGNLLIFNTGSGRVSIKFSEPMVY